MEFEHTSTYFTSPTACGSEIYLVEFEQVVAVEWNPVIAACPKSTLWNLNMRDVRAIVPSALVRNLPCGI